MKSRSEWHIEVLYKYSHTIYYDKISETIRGVYFQKFNLLLLPIWAYLWQKSGRNTVKDWSERKIKLIIWAQNPWRPL